MAATATAIVLVDWDWAESNPDDPCVRDAQGRSEEAAVKIGMVAIDRPPASPEALWSAVNGADWSDVSYLVDDGVRETVASAAEGSADGCLLVVIRNDRIMGGVLR